MRTYFSTILGDLFEAKKTLRGGLMHPDQVPTGEYKTYPRMTRILLPEPAQITVSLSEALARRRSMDSSRAHAGFTQQGISDLLGHALRMRSSTSRQYPSGGALFPVETYLVGEVLDGETPHAYHYVPTHELERLWPIAADDYRACVTDPDAPDHAALLIFAAQWERSQRKYGDFAYHLATIEGGHMAQNILLCAAALGIRAKPVCGIALERMSTILDLDIREQPFYGVILCNEPR